MKTTILQISILIALLIGSCAKEPFIRFGFSTTFNENSRGLSIMKVASDLKVVNLTGGIKVYEGKVVLELYDPDGDQIFSKQFEGPATYEIHEVYNATSGYWKLRYSSIGGTGRLSVHLYGSNLIDL